MEIRKLFTTCLLASAMTMVAAGSANAALFDFRAMADNPLDPNYEGESGWNPLDVTVSGLNLKVTGTSTSDFESYINSGGVNGSLSSEYAYLDAGNAGLGVCTVLNTEDQCTPGNDDNILTEEVLVLTFTEEVTLQEIMFWGYGGNHNPFPANHNEDFALFVDGTFIGNENFGANGIYDSLITGTWFAFAADDYDNGSNGACESQGGFCNDDDQFYVASITVPEPGSLALLGMGLAGLGLARRKKS